ncbi:MAG: hypothetical protein K6C34_03060 [Alphaproteobacteria bacterium]|nr:hypothetical protein [Alphaproteobacteria bacterium]
MSTLFATARSSIAHHIGNIFKEGELDPLDIITTINMRSEKADFMRIVLVSDSAN